MFHISKVNNIPLRQIHLHSKPLTYSHCRLGRTKLISPRDASVHATSPPGTSNLVNELTLISGNFNQPSRSATLMCKLLRGAF